MTEGMAVSESAAGPSVPSVGEWMDVVRFAVRAPSIHNTQPWRWVLSGGRLSLYADRSRQLGTVDPDGRALVVSCGGALALAVLRLAAGGWQPVVERLPEPAGPAGPAGSAGSAGSVGVDLLARVGVAGRREPDEVTLARARAAEDRRTERRPFRAEPVPAEVVDSLVAAASVGGPVGGVYGFAVQQAEQRVALAVAMSWADRVEAADPAYRAELARWVGPAAAAAGEGVPASAVPHLTGGPRHTEVPVRDFEAGARGEQEITGEVDEQPAYLVLLSDGDGPRQRLAAGEAYLQVSVEATRLGLASSAMTQAVDLPGVRERFRALMNWPDHPQMVLRVGYPPPGATPTPTPRRPLSTVLTIEDGD